MTTPTPGRTGPDLFAARADARLTAWGLRTPLRRDVALAALVAVVSAVLVGLIVSLPPSVAEQPLDGGPLAAAAVALGLGALVLCLRRRAPGTCLVVIVALQTVALLVLPAGGTVRGPAAVVAAYTCAALLPARRTAALVAACVVVETATFLGVSAVALPADVTVPLAVGYLVVGVLLYGGAAVGGAFVATRRRYADLLRVHAEEVVEIHRARAEAAVGSERARMARELHDIAAHHLSGMVVQAAVVERLIDRDPAAARENAAQVRRQGKETLQSLRLVVGALRECGGPGTADRDPDGLPDGGGPVPGLAALDRLAEAGREAGTPVRIVREGPAPELGPVADVTFYRVAQQALANAAEHAPGGAVRVLLHRGVDTFRLEVQNDLVPGGPTPPGPDRGFGLAGMAERAQLVGAGFDAGPTGDGGWRVVLTLPLGHEPGDES